MTASQYKFQRSLRGTQEEVARALGVSRVTIARREIGKHPIPQEAEMALRALPVKLANQPKP